MRDRKWRPRPIRALLGAKLRGAVIALLALVCSGCAASRGDPTALPGATDLAEHALLDVQILPFHPGLSEDAEIIDERVYPDIRRAEANYFPCLLRATLAGTGQWGAVEVAPRRSDAFDLTVEGRVVQSDGDTLKIEIEASDASGRRWLRERYEMETSLADYVVPATDPYQLLFNAIANDLVEAREDLSDKDLQNIRTISELRFAEAFAPDAFAGYLEEDDGELEIVRLPARDDPMPALLAEVRGREAMFIATQSSHFERFCSEMSEPYREWRRLARAEAVLYKRLRNEAYLRKGAAVGLAALTILAGVKGSGILRDVAVVAGTLGTVGLWSSGSQKQIEANFHKDTLAEINRSFQIEVRPMVVAVGGRTVKLTGTVDEQYDEWRRLLQELYEADSGMSADLEVSIQPDEIVGPPPPLPAEP